MSATAESVANDGVAMGLVTSETTVLATTTGSVAAGSMIGLPVPRSVARSTTRTLGCTLKPGGSTESGSVGTNVNSRPWMPAGSVRLRVAGPTMPTPPAMSFHVEPS
ncbi:MAG TPA: hypothetical protein PLS63_00180 [Microthrixaceae bacterium]|nr:hypothetical protein [Microthrixaceae bacterium]HPU37959.1 hypothetical protein [Microthrixaceae bacterium]